MSPARFATWSNPACARMAVARGAPARVADRDNRSILSRFCQALCKRPERDQPGPADPPEQSTELLRLADIDDLYRRRVLFQPLRVDLPHAREGVGHGRPGRIGPFSALVGRAAASQVGRHRDVDLLRVRQADVVHVAHEVTLVDVAAQARVEAALLADAGHRQAPVVVGRVDEAGFRQGEEAL